MPTLTTAPKQDGQGGASSPAAATTPALAQATAAKVATRATTARDPPLPEKLTREKIIGGGA